MALTDHAPFARDPFQKACQKGGIKPILGCEITSPPPTPILASRPPARAITSCCCARTRICNLPAGLQGYLEGLLLQAADRHWNLLEAHHKGLIATSACMQGPICQAILERHMAEAKPRRTFVQIFGRGNFYPRNHGSRHPDQKQVNDGTDRTRRRKPAAGRHQRLPLPRRRSLRRARRAAVHPDGQEARRSGPDALRAKRVLPEIARGDDAAVRPCGWGDRATRCDRRALQLRDPDQAETAAALPPARWRSRADFLRSWSTRASRGATARRRRPNMLERAEFELGVIEKMGFVDYFLVVWDFIDWARSNGIPVGPGRGSGAGSIVAYCLGITDLDRSRTACSSSASSTPSASPCPTSTSTSASNAAARSSNTSATNTARMRRPDHHLRHDEGPQRDPRRRPRDGPPPAAGRSGRQAGPRRPQGRRSAAALGDGPEGHTRTRTRPN